MREQTMEEPARSIISGYIEDIIGHMDSSNDGMLAPWMMAKMRCHEMEDALQAVCDAISSRPGPSQRALQAVALQDMDLEFMEAGHISAKPDPFFQQSTGYVCNVPGTPGEWARGGLLNRDSQVIDDVLNMLRPRP